MKNRIMLNLTRVQMAFHLKRGNVVAFTDSVFNLARDEGGVVALYVYPFWPLPIFGSRIFYRKEKNYDWLKNHHSLIKKSVVCRGVKLEAAPRSRGIYAAIVCIMCRLAQLYQKEK